MDGRQPALTAPCEPDPEQFEDLTRSLGPEGPFPWKSDRQREDAKSATDALLVLVDQSFSEARFEGGPEPEPVLRIAPDI